MIPRLNSRFWSSTRGRIVSLLREKHRTVNELAAALSLTDNAVRAHLVGLERDNLIQPTGTQRGTRKPNIVYGLTPATEQLFPKLYGPILGALLDSLKESATPKKLDALVRDAGQRIAASHLAATKSVKRGNPLKQAAAVLNELGGFCAGQHEDGKIVFRCSECPLAAVVANHPEVCRLIETILKEVLELPVQERCAPADPPRCAFEISVLG